MTRWQRWRECVRYALLGPTPLDRFTASVHATEAAMSAFMGRRPATHYERHRDRFERTGDMQELERMLRHVQPADDVRL